MPKASARAACCKRRLVRDDPDARMTPTTAFWVGAIGLALLACLLLVLPAGRPRRADDRQRRNLLLQRQQLAALDLELASGQLAPNDHRDAIVELERAVLEEADAPSGLRHPVRKSQPAESANSRRLAYAMGAAIAVAAFGMYAIIGNMKAIESGPSGFTEANAARRTIDKAPAISNSDATKSTGAGAEADASNAPVEAMLDTMAESMARQRDGTVDAAGWSLVARSYAALQRFEDASQAYARAIALAPNDAQLLADQSDVLSMMQGRRMSGEPIRLANRALQIDPDNLKALALAGSEAFERKDLTAAEDFWRRARRLSPAGAFAEGIDRNLAAVTAAQGRSPESASEARIPAPAKLRVGGRLRVAPQLASRIAPTDEVFVFAREPGTAGMPIAIARFSARNLPIDFVLDASNAMVDQGRIAGLSRVEIGARVSRTGDATPRAGDLRGKSGPVAIDTGDLTITIDDVTP
ncbi:MAG: c-type cytochrome biogenesis protein CcmI [Variovorax sp.]|nr:MAG: c-type cytochrome biogenesis protein CcmI [Variovorax sp.]